MLICMNSNFTEVECLMRVKHKNVVRFLGYCADTQGNMGKYNGKLVMADVQNRLLCFEYIPEGSLDKYIADAYREWGTCYKIIKGICAGLHYLHQNQIVHMDLKPANILLGHNKVPKITDFGLSRSFDENQSRHITKNIIGTLGYLAPELREAGIIARSADLYSLGVIILEILTGQRGYQPIREVLESWNDRLEISRRDTLCEQIRVCYETALECIDFNPEKRPASAQNIIDRLHEMESIQGHESHDTSCSGYCGTDDCQSQCSGGGPATPDSQGVASIVSRDIFERLLPHRDDAACPARGFYTYDAFIAAAAAFPSFGTMGSTEIRKQEVAAFFAQTSHETTGGWPTAPDGPFSWGYCYKQELNPPSTYYCVPSPEWPCAPGKQYYGRGPMQLSYNYNYGPAGRAIGVDLLNNPDLVATDSVVSFKTALWYWMTAHGNKPSCHAVMTGQWIPTAADIAAGRLPGYGVITNIINGPMECGRGPNPRVADRIGFYKHYCDILDVGNLNCYNQQPFT